jgi:transcription elongation factor GreB
MPAETDAQKRKLEARIRLLQLILQSAVITHAPTGSRERVCFGAAVLIRDKEGEQTTYQIVGIDETNLDRGYISWRSPLARALLGHRAGDQTHFDSPSGRKELEILSVTYD